MIDLQLYSFSGSVAVPARAGGCTGANLRRRPHAEEEKEPRELDREGSRHAGGLDRSRPRPGAPTPRRANAPARHLTHARILLKADEGGAAPSGAWSDTKIADALEVSRSTVSRVRTRFVEEG